MVGLLPLCAVTVFDGRSEQKYPEIMKRFQTLHRGSPGIDDLHSRSEQGRRTRPPARRDPGRNQAAPRAGQDARRKRIPQRLRHPLALALPRRPSLCLPRRAARSIAFPTCRANPTRGMFGGNSNWRGPIWMPVNALIIRALAAILRVLRRRLHRGMSHRLRPADEPLPGGRGASRRRLTSIFLKDEDGRRPVYGGARKFQEDPHWRDCIQFYEYFHGDNGAGLGASHQTGWTGVIARAMHLFATTTAGAGARTWRRRPPLVKPKRPELQSADVAGGEQGLNAPRYPSLYQINTRVWLTELSTKTRPARRRWTTSPTPNSTAWPRWASTGSGS